MQKMQAGSRTVYYARSHHHVLAAWTKLRRGLSEPPHLVTLDRHTDLMHAFRRSTCRQVDPNMLGLVTATHVRHGAVAGSAKLAALTQAAAKAAIKDLAHDEHIDAARRANVVGQVFVLQSHAIGESVYWARVQSFDVPDAGTADEILEPQRLDPFILMIEHHLGTKIEDASYILDIDLDYFYTRDGAKPTNPATFHRLIRNAAMITIALEPQCVREPDLLDRGISAKRLLELIRAEIAKA